MVTLKVLKGASSLEIKLFGTLDNAMRSHYFNFIHIRY